MMGRSEIGKRGLLRSRYRLRGLRGVSSQTLARL